jgi:hypothetical protein
MRTRLCALVAVTTAALTLGVAGAQDAVASAPTKARQEAPARKKKHKATTTTVATKSASLPSDACKLLTADEVGTLVANADAGKPDSANAGGVKQVECNWETQDLTVQTLHLAVITVPPQTTAAAIKAALLAEAKDDGKTVSGLGDAAIVTSSIPGDAEVKVLTGKLILSLDYQSQDPPGGSKQDDVVALAKLAVGRL